MRNGEGLGVETNLAAMADIQLFSLSSTVAVPWLWPHHESSGREKQRTWAQQGWLPARIASTVYNRIGESAAIVRLHTENCSHGTHCRCRFKTSRYQVGLLVPETSLRTLANPSAQSTSALRTCVSLWAFQWIVWQKCCWNLTRRQTACLWVDYLAESWKAATVRPWSSPESRGKSLIWLGAAAPIVDGSGFPRALQLFLGELWVLFQRKCLMSKRTVLSIFMGTAWLLERAV